MQSKNIQITPPNFQIGEFKIEGTAPFVQCRFPEKAKQAMRAKMELGSQAKKGMKRVARDFASEFEQAMYKSSDGWRGIPASSFRNALISACRVVGFQMTKAKLTIFAEADGIDKLDGTPLIKIEGKPEHVEHTVRIQQTTDIRVRAMWREWNALVRLKYDADMFSLEDVTNLLVRVGMQVGVGEGRPDGKTSCGMGWGTFKIVK